MSIKNFIKEDNLKKRRGLLMSESDSENIILPTTTKHKKKHKEVVDLINKMREGGSIPKARYDDEEDREWDEESRNTSSTPPDTPSPTGRSASPSPALFTPKEQHLPSTTEKSYGYTDSKSSYSDAST